MAIDTNLGEGRAPCQGYAIHGRDSRRPLCSGHICALRMVGFEALLRTGELLTLTVGNIRFEKDSNVAGIQLPGTKTGQRY